MTSSRRVILATVAAALLFDASAWSLRVWPPMHGYANGLQVLTLATFAVMALMRWGDARHPSAGAA